jgi:hypothetical protein
MSNAVIKFKLDSTTNELVPASVADEKRLTLFKKQVPTDNLVDAYLTLEVPGDKTIGQLAKVHALIKELANGTGHSIDEIKTEVKRKAGLFTVTETSNYDYKSFRECSKSELSKAIETSLEIGHMLGYYMD